MNSENNALEELSKQYNDLLSSREYYIGTRYLRHINSIKKLDIKSLLLRFRKYRTHKRVMKDRSIHRQEVFYNSGEPDYTGAKGVVYTCITNGYDRLKQPIFTNENVDYICFTDNIDKQDANTKWKVMSIPEEALKHGGRLVNRYCKMHPTELFPNYDYAIYIDGNVQTVSDMSYLYSVAKKSKTGIAMHLHSNRNSVYEEAEACILYKRGNVDQIKELVSSYKEEGFPAEAGLYEATIIVFDLHNENVNRIMLAWWEELNSKRTNRDQLSFPYVLWKYGYCKDDMGILGNNEYKNYKFIIFKHD